MTTATTTTATERAEALETLRGMFKGKRTRSALTVYCILRHVNRMGTSRVIDLLVIRDGVPFRISWNVCKALGYTYDRTHSGVRIRGGGMDMGLAIVYNLSRAMFQGSHLRQSFHRKDKGYVLRCEWL